MRTYGRVGQTDGLGGTWVVVETDPNGFNDSVFITALVQCLKLRLGESPIYANYGIPAQQSIVTQVYPDYYAAVTQNQFSANFAALAISRKLPQVGANPKYLVNIVGNSGATLSTEVAT